MRVIVCPDKFAGTLCAVEVAAAVAEGWRCVAPADEVQTRPLSDGGPGFVDVLGAALGGSRVRVPTLDPLGRPVTGEILLTPDAAYVESAQACGLHLLAPQERDPKRTTSFGLGALVLAAVESGARTVVVGLGGSGTNDAGAGFLAAVGLTPLDASGMALPYGGAALVHCASVDGAPRLRDAMLVGATDVDNPLTGLHGASAVYGPQKGASPEDVHLLDHALGRFSHVMTSPRGNGVPNRENRVLNKELAATAGAGAAGGLGFALLALGGRVESGIGLVRRLSGLDAALDEADLVITGEGSFDEQSLRGKVVAGVAGAARERGLPCVVVAGRVSAGRREAAAAGVAEAYSLVEHFGDVGEAMARPADGLRALGARLAQQWSR